MECKIIKEVNSENFEGEMIESDLPVVICFTTSWCRTCLPSCLTADKLADKYDGKVKFVKIDKEKSDDIAKEYGISVVPTMLILSKGVVIKKIIGYQRQTYLIKLIEKLMDENNLIYKQTAIDLDNMEELIIDR
jgi:thioredoxin 1